MIGAKPFSAAGDQYFWTGSPVRKDWDVVVSSYPSKPPSTTFIPVFFKISAHKIVIGKPGKGMMFGANADAFAINFDKAGATSKKVHKNNKFKFSQQIRRYSLSYM